jgi:hypothetical protein
MSFVFRGKTLYFEGKTIFTYNKKSEIVLTCNHKKKFLVNNGRNACIVNDSHVSD